MIFGNVHYFHFIKMEPAFFRVRHLNSMERVCVQACVGVRVCVGANKLSERANVWYE